MQEPRAYFRVTFERRPKYQKEIERIERKLGQFLVKELAQETATKIYNLAAEVDEELDRILDDPLVHERYEYDGRFFTPRGTQLFHRAFDGVNVLESLDDGKIDTFFGGRNKAAGLRWLLEELGTHTWEAKIRRLHWEEEHSLNTVSKEVIEAIVEDIKERRRNEPKPLTPGERAFFGPYEKDMRELYRKP